VSADGKIRCLLVHDHLLLRQGLRRLLEDEPDLEIVCEASDGVEALQRVFECRPEMVIADAHSFGLAAEDAKQLILQQSPQSKILFLTMHEGEEPPVRETGGNGVRCTVQHTSAEELAEMVRRVCRRSTAGDSAGHGNSEHNDWVSPGAVPRGRALTVREREVLKLLAEGRTVRSAASILGLSVKTVDAHKFNLMRKLGLHNKAELVMWAIQERVVNLPAGSQ
jgi:two-component system, NarL family, response regulator NreC